jgi:hypothetical protein
MTKTKINKEKVSPVETIMDLTDKQVKDADKEYIKLHSEGDSDTLYTAKKIIKKLGLDGLWRGRDTAVLIVYDALIKQGDKKNEN